MTIDLAILAQSGPIKKDSEFVKSITQKELSPMQKEAVRRADILRNMQGCSKCRARLENPHADYHLTAVIDSDKI